MIPWSNSLAQGFPKIVLLGKDTAIAFSRSQSENIARTYLNLDQVIELYDSAIIDLDRYQILIAMQDEYAASIARERDYNGELVNLHLQMIASLNRDIRRQKIKSKLIGVVTIGLIVGLVVK